MRNLLKTKNMRNLCRASLLVLGLLLGASSAKAVVMVDPGGGAKALAGVAGIASGGVQFDASGDSVNIAMLIIPAVDRGYIVREDTGIIVQVLPPASGSPYGWVGAFSVPSELEVNTQYFLAGGAVQDIGQILSSPVGTTESFLLRGPSGVPNGVPDGGASGMLLGVALATLGTIRRYTGARP